MRVLFVISGLGLGGAEKQVVLLAQEMAHRGHRVCIYALTARVPRAESLGHVGVELIVDPKKTRLDIHVIGRLRRHLLSWKPDVVHGFLYDGNIYARVASAGLGIAVLDSERNDNYSLPLLHSLGYFLTSAMSRGVVANSHSGAEFAARNYIRAGKDLHVVWNGIDLADVDARLAASGPAAREVFPGDGIKRVAVVGSIKPQKDLVLAMRVARRLVETDDRWRMIVVGDKLPNGSSGYRAEVLRVRDELGMQQHVKFVGRRQDVPEIMASCDAVLVTSRHEGFPNVVLEAMACQVPVASTDYSDVRRILPMDWQVVPSRDEGDLAAALFRCDRERAAVVSAQRKWVETHATPDICTERLLSIYSSYIEMAPTVAEQVG